MNYQFPKSLRLRKRSDYLAVQRAGTTRHSRYFVVVSNRSGYGRLGITVSKKVGNAAVRNRVKRLVREFVRRARPIGGHPWLPSSLDVVVIAKREAADASASEIWADLSAHGPRLERESLH